MYTNQIIIRFLSAFLVLIAMIFLPACTLDNPFQTDVSKPTPLPVVVSEASILVEGKIVPQEYAYLAFPSGGEISSINVQEGDIVAKDDVLASLGKREQAEAALTAALLEQLSAQQALDELERNADVARSLAQQALTAANLALNDAQKAYNDLNTADFRDDLDDKEIAVQDAQEELDEAQEELDKYLNLDQDNQTRKNAQERVDDAQRELDDAIYERDQMIYELDAAEAALELAQTRQEQAQQDFDDLQDGPDPDDLALAQARMDNADAQVAAARLALENMDLKAPFAGNVIEVEDLVPGEYVSSAQPVITLADVSQWYVETKDLSELDVVDLSVGQVANIIPDAMPEVTLIGVVESISQVYTERSGDILYTVRIRLNSFQEGLLWGMTVEVDFNK